MLSNIPAFTKLPNIPWSENGDIDKIPKSFTPDQLVIGPYVTTPDDRFGYMEHHVTFAAEDGTKLNGWLFNRGPNKPLVVWYPGKLSHVGGLVQHAANDPERSYLLMNYRGFGWSEGTPKEWNMVADASHCISICREIIGGYSSLIIMGYSLGTGVAVQVAAAEKADKLFLLAPYDCIFHATLHLVGEYSPSPEVLNRIIFGPMIGDMFQSDRHAPRVTCPVVIYIAEYDNVIPNWSTWNLFHAFTSTHPKHYMIDCDHGGFLSHHKFWDTYWQEMTLNELDETNCEQPWTLVEKGDHLYCGKNGYTKDANRALELYRKAAELDYDWGYYNVGKCYLEGQGVPKDDDEARKWFRKAANQNNVWAKVRLAELGDAICMTEVGDCYYSGSAESQNLHRNPDEAYKWYLKSAEGGYHWGYYNVGKCYVEGLGVAKDDNEARKWFRKAEELGDNPWATYWLAELGDIDSAHRVSEYYATGSHESWGMYKSEPDAERFRNKVTELCAALVQEGDHYYDTQNRHRDVNKAWKYYRKAAHYGYHWGCYNVGKCYMEGQGVAKDDDEARKWFRKAADQDNVWAKVGLAELGDAVCMTEVGDCYYCGSAESQNLHRNPDEAYKWYLKSAEGGYHWGYFNVGKCYVEGIGVAKDDDEARKWFRKAEELGDNPWATYWLAELGDIDCALQVIEYFTTGSRENWGMHKNEAEATRFRHKVAELCSRL